MDRFKCTCGNDEFEPWPIMAREYTKAQIKCKRCGKEWGLPKVISDGMVYEEDDK